MSMSLTGGIVILAALALASGLGVLAAIAAAIEVLPPRSASVSESGGGGQQRVFERQDRVAQVG
jgi:hypothetical protein